MFMQVKGPHMAVEQGGQLSYEGIGHYQKTVKILAETDRIMRENEMGLE